MAQRKALVIVCGVTASLWGIEEKLRVELESEIEHSHVCGGEVLERGEQTFGKALCCLGDSLALHQLRALHKILRPGATVVLWSCHGHLSDTLSRDCILSGFLAPDQDTDDKSQLRVKKPEWDVGAKSEVKQKPVTKWTVTLDDDDDELLDDDDFLSEEDLKPAPLIQGGKVPVKKACENCTCGAAEGKEPVKLTQELLDNPVTSCGSCGLGDAYRCASCPYRGLPSFEPGKKIELPEGFLISDL